MTTRIRPGVPKALRDLNDAVAKASNTVFELHIESPPEAFDQAADELFAAFNVARDLSRPRSATGCNRHPQGPKEPDPPDGWGDCLLCNTYRRRAARGPYRRPE